MAKRVVLIKTPAISTPNRNHNRRMSDGRRNERQRETPPHSEQAPVRLLYSRRQAKPLLGDISVATMLRLEALGVLIPIKPNGTPTSMTFYSHENLLAVARARGTDDAEG